jgi:uncharacterized protein (DUF2336 family)
MMQQPITDTPASTASASSISLSAQDVARLISEDSAGARIDVLEKMAAGHAGHRLDEHEQEIAQQIFRILMNDSEVKVRIALADALKDDDQAPRDVILHMSDDIPPVALKVIEHSDVLSSADLIRIIRRSGDQPERQIAVARRKHVPVPVSTALVETKQPDIVSALVGNAGADISETGYLIIVDTFPAHEQIAAALAERDLPITIVEKLIHQATDKVGEELRRKYQVGTAKFKADTERTRELATLRLLDGKVSSQDIERLVEQMHAHGRLTVSLALTALCRGNLEFFEIVLARLAEIPVRNARLLVEDKGELGFKALYEKARLPESLYKATRAVLTALLSLKDETVSGAQLSNRLVERVLSYSEEIENLSYIIALIRQNNLH